MNKSKPDFYPFLIMTLHLQLFSAMNLLICCLIGLPPTIRSATLFRKELAKKGARMPVQAGRNKSPLDRK
jgi:hypothetical protein